MRCIADLSYLYIGVYMASSVPQKKERGVTSRSSCAMNWSFPALGDDQDETRH